MNNLFTLLFSIVSFFSLAQTPDYILGKNDKSRIDSIWLLPDNNYDINKISSDTTLRFERNVQVEYGKHNVYWLRFTIANPSKYSGKYSLWLHPQLQNTLFAFNLDSAKWLTQTSGLLVTQSSRQTGAMSISVPADTVCTYYIRIDVSRLSDFQYSSGPGLHIYTADHIDNREAMIRVIWLGTLAVVMVFFLYNAYVWYFFRDKTYLYYLLIQLGAMIYITGFHQYFNLLLPFRHVVFFPTPGGSLYFYDINQLILETAIILIMTGFIQLTRTYLETKHHLPTWDKILVYFNYFFAAFTSLNIIVTTTGIFFLSYYTVLYVNLGVIAVICMMLFTGVMSIRKRYKPGKYFLLANSVPLIVMLCLAGYFALYTFHGNGSVWLPSVAIVSQSVALAVALVARVQLLKDELHDKEMIVQEEKSRNEKLREKLDYNQRELASSAMFSFQKNKLLADLKRNIDQLTETTPLAMNPEIKKIKSTIQSNMLLDNEWEKFKLHFEQVHPDFFDELKMTYSNLTQNEIRLSAYFKINLSVKEIAALTNIDPESVRKAKTRLNKKINQTEVNAA